MKISVFDLKVVKTKENCNAHYFICKNKVDPYTFVEALTGRRIIVENLNDVEPLCKYYPVLAIANYQTGKPLFLDKKAIINKCLEININKARRAVEENYEENKNKNNIDDSTTKTDRYRTTKERLAEAAKKFFPKYGSWSASEFTKSSQSLIQHLRDNNWLAAELQSRYLEDIDYPTIVEYVKTEEFSKLRDEYEQIIVKWQIEWMKSGGEGWIVPEEYGDDFALYYGTCDLAFRKGVVLTLKAINMNEDAIEEGIEKNANIWRQDLMKRAYHNTYKYPIFSCIDPSDIPEDKEHEEKWFKLRMYDYYQEHKDSVDKYGEVTEEMLITPEEAEELRVYLAIKHEEKMADIERAKEKNKTNIYSHRLTPEDYFK